MDVGKSSYRMPNIKTLIPDIYQRLASGEPFNKEDVDEFANSLARKLASRLSEERGTTRLRLSNWASPCERQLWYKVNRPDVVEELPANARLKFLFGDVLEELLLFLARASGHEVLGEQDELEVAGVQGHRDGIIDGHLVDAKSASPYGFLKFKNHSLEREDSFGYLGQLETYFSASRDDPRLTDTTGASFLAVNKVSGDLALDTYNFDRGHSLVESIQRKKLMLARPTPPPRGFAPEPMGAKGNQKLPTACSYCPVKAACHPGLRAFAYSSGPVYLTEVCETPKVPEIPVGPSGED